MSTQCFRGVSAKKTLHVEGSQLRGFGPLVRRLPGRLPVEVFQRFISPLAWEGLGVPTEELLEVDEVKNIWGSLIRLLPPKHGPV